MMKRQLHTHLSGNKICCYQLYFSKHIYSYFTIILSIYINLFYISLSVVNNLFILLRIFNYTHAEIFIRESLFSVPRLT